jgi:hypothetical protein
MKYRGIEYSLKSIGPGQWKYQFRIGRAFKNGMTKTEIESSAIERVERRIDRELRIAGLEEGTD